MIATGRVVIMTATHHTPPHLAEIGISHPKYELEWIEW